MTRKPNPSFWRGKRVLLTGHTGFKGAWAAFWLLRMGAKVTGLSLPPEGEPNLFTLLAPWQGLDAITVDLRDRAHLSAEIKKAEPEIILHMAAQALVRRSYQDPLETFSSNVQGTAHLLEAARGLKDLKALLVVTTDKVYENPETGQPFGEDAPLGGHDPYSASKAAAEIITASYARSFFADQGVAVATARAGNVIGGGDFAADRIIPDLWRAYRSGGALALRYGEATRPWQHVLDCLCGYFLYLEDMAVAKPLPAALNFGPDWESGQISVKALAQIMQRALGGKPAITIDTKANPHERRALALDNRRSKEVLGWQPGFSIEAAIEQTASWYRGFAAGADPGDLVTRDLNAFEGLA